MAYAYAYASSKDFVSSIALQMAVGLDVHNISSGHCVVSV